TLARVIARDGDPVSATVEPHAIRPDLDDRRAFEKRGLGDLGHRRVARDTARALELEAHSRSSPSKTAPRPGEKGEVEACGTVATAAVEVEPLGPRAGPPGRVRDR